MEPGHGGAAEGEIELGRRLFEPRNRLAAVSGEIWTARLPGRAIRTAHGAPLVGLVAQLLLIVAIAEAAAIGGAGLNGTGWVVGIACGVIMDVALAHALVHYRARRMSPADWVTLARATLAVGVAALVAGSFGREAHLTWLLALAIPALILDAVDGWVARRTRTEAALGARFDGEVDAFLILVLSVYVARSAGGWVLAIGAARYLFLAAGWPLGWMRAPLPPREWRKVVAATQGIVLVIAASGVLPAALSRVAVAGALVLLAESFGRDVWWLRRHRRIGTQHVVAATDTNADAAVDPGPDAVVDPDPDPGAAGEPPPGTGRGPTRQRISLALTILAAVIVWAALVAPDQPQYLTLDGFLRIPLEGLALVALAVVLPPTGRRIVAWIAGPVLALIVILKVLDFGFFHTFDRPFDPIGDSHYAGIGLETLRDSVGRSEADLIVAAIVIGAIVMAVLATLSVLRLTRVVAANRTWALRLVAGLATVWALCWVIGAQFISHTPIASTLSAGVLVDEVQTVQADIDDEGIFANEIKQDSISTTPASALLTRLRGKDVLLVFIEAYGQRAVQGTSFSPGVDAVLTRGDQQLASAGFSARSGFLTSATFGGISWLAHSTLQSGLWVNSQRRYDQLTTTNRFTLSDAFKEAGWRTVADVPSNNRFWPQGVSFYHYDKLYDQKDVGYRGTKFSYATMPDQYIYLAFQRLELSKQHRRPLFAEIDTVSSHEPWSSIPEQIPWNEVGNGSIFDRLPALHLTPGLLGSTKSTQEAYGRSIQYAMSTLVSFVQHYGKKNLVLIVLGDHQPEPAVSGYFSNRDVPISIIAHDPAVLKRISGWGWGPGLQPSPNAPVWPMSAFRNRFLDAFDTPGATK
jgi:phosphatidylglycerophosphate synthase